MELISYLFWPRPPQVGYDNPKVQAVLVMAAALIVFSIVLRRWRRRVSNQQTKKLSKSWATASVWFGIVSLILGASRAEDISYLSMRFLWVVWAFVLVVYIFIQIRVFRARHYETLPREQVEDPRAKYLPKRKKR